MGYLILYEGSRGANAYSLSLLAGCSGYSTEAEFVEACEDDVDLLKSAVSQVDPFMIETGITNYEAHQSLKKRMESLKLDIHSDISPRMLSPQDKEFEKLLRSGQGAVLVQAGRLDSFRKNLTATALSIAAAVALSLSAVPQESQAAGFDQFAKNALGGVVGAAIGGQFGGGRGKTIMTGIGAAAGVMVAESMQHPQQPEENNSHSANGEHQGQRAEGEQVARRQSTANQNQYGVVAGGTVVLSPDKRDKMVSMERDTLATRDAFAKSLATAQQAEDNRVLSPRDKSSYEAALAANTGTQTHNQKYSQARSDFDNAYEYLAGRGYDVHEFSYTYMLTQKQVTAQDVNYRDMEKTGAARVKPEVAVLNESSRELQ